MGDVIRLDHARASVGSTKLPAVTSPPVSLSIAVATLKDGLRFPERISDRCDLETPTARAKADCGASLPRTILARRSRPSMSISLPQVNLDRQVVVYCEKIDKPGTQADNLGMTMEPSLIERRLYIGEWIKALGMTQVEVAKKSGLKKSYLNLLCKRKRGNPSLKVLQAIADAMDLNILDLQSPPPPQHSIESIQNISIDLIERLRRRRTA